MDLFGNKRIKELEQKILDIYDQQLMNFIDLNEGDMALSCLNRKVSFINSLGDRFHPLYCCGPIMIDSILRNMVTTRLIEQEKSEKEHKEKSKLIKEVAKKLRKMGL